MRLRNIAHKGLRRLYQENSSKSVRADTVEKIRKMLTFLDAMEDPNELRTLPLWNAHVLTGDRKGTWSLYVTRNVRLTFRIEADEIVDMNLEDYH
jgi:proteic killer suppression protein